MFSDFEYKMNLDIVYIDVKITRCVTNGMDLGSL